MYFLFFFFKQKTAYEMRISDWSSDVCSSDLHRCAGVDGMTPLDKVEGRAIPFGLKNVDTDVIIPAHWLKTTTREGMGRGAFESLRADPDNLFDSADFKGAPILIAGANFGCGSSRSEERSVG